MNFIQGQRSRSPIWFSNCIVFVNHWLSCSTYRHKNLNWGCTSNNTLGDYDSQGQRSRPYSKNLTVGYLNWLVLSLFKPYHVFDMKSWHDATSVGQNDHEWQNTVGAPMLKHFHSLYIPGWEIWTSRPRRNQESWETASRENRMVRQTTERLYTTAAVRQPTSYCFTNQNDKGCE